MSKVWTVIGPKTAVTAAQDLMEIAPSAGRPVEILSVRIGQNNRSQDAEDAMQRVQILRGHTTTGSGGSSETPAALTSPSDGATCGATCAAFNTTPASGGTAVTLVEDCFDVRAGWLYVPTPDERPQAPVTTNRIVVTLPDAPSASTNFSITVNFREIG